MVKDFEKLMTIEDEKELINELQRFDISITDCYYDSAIEMFKDAFKEEIEENDFVQELVEMLDEQKVHNYLAEGDCVNKIGKYYVFYDC